MFSSALLCCSFLGTFEFRNVLLHLLHHPIVEIPPVTEEKEDLKSLDSSILDNSSGKLFLRMESKRSSHNGLPNNGRVTEEQIAIRVLSSTLRRRKGMAAVYRYAKLLGRFSNIN